MNDTMSKTELLDLLSRWQAFSLIQQRAFAFLAAEALATGQEFEESTGGATRVLTRLADVDLVLDPAQVQAETWAVVHKLQAADRSRQGLEQVASVLETLRREHHDLMEASQRVGAALIAAEAAESWAESLAGCVSLADWRRRLEDALHGRDPGPREPQPTGDEEELF